jgi:DNA-binding HxlR family transcriptional regulator
VSALPTASDILKPIYARKFAREILELLAPGPLRYTDIQTQLTVSEAQAVHPHTLSETLRWLGHQNYVARHTTPPAYALTGIGRSLVRILGEVDEIDIPNPELKAPDTA